MNTASWEYQANTERGRQQSNSLSGEYGWHTTMLLLFPHRRPAPAASILHQHRSLWASSNLSEMLRVTDCLAHVGSKERKVNGESRCSESEGSRLWIGVASTSARTNSTKSVMSDAWGEAQWRPLCHCPPLYIFRGTACQKLTVLWSVSCFFDVSVHV